MNGAAILAVFIFGVVALLMMFLIEYWLIVLAIIAGIIVAAYFIHRAESENKMTALTYRIDELGGVEFENCISELVKRNGYTNVRTTKASGDYGIDVLCDIGNVSCGIQCKRYSKRVGVKAVQEAIAGKQYYKLDKVIVATNSYFTENAIEMARKGNVCLWNRDKIIQMLKDNGKQQNAKTNIRGL